MKTKIMKVLSTLLLTSLTLSILFIGCNKNGIDEDITPADENTYKADYAMESLHLIWIENDYILVCLEPAVNCLPEVEIGVGQTWWERLFFKSSNAVNVSDSTAFSQFISAIDNETTDDFFSGSNYSQLFPYLDVQDFSDYLDILQTDTVRIIDYGYHPSDSVFRYIVVSVNNSSNAPDPDDTYMTLQIKFIEE